ncbi:hypothetical protein ROJ8625_02224 [Roseivivax jejudonensis]|uniref:Transmembrane transcriptional regulator (Anti-sigma factor RsiW) n=1 Tax=Roseivivax jejudonensis TaxID=1529041 RepID=A0A1X6ZAK9_9RHOB|nr:hypothetical protein [Roseivivax jejudonensis]SLN46119.1 hypothetical protein ROJ8625_02224 [Roseivivax jejudonensis]
MTERPDDEDTLQADTLAFIESRLAPERSYDLAGYLADRPDRAAALLSDARDIAGLRLALAAPETPAPPSLLAQARRLQDRLRWRGRLRRSAPIAAALVLFAAGWTGHGVFQKGSRSAAPPLVEAALDAHAALELRHWMASQPESASLDPQEILAALGVEIPSLPADWTVRDVQVVATPDRPGVAIAVDTPDFGPIFLLAVSRSMTTVPAAPTAFEYDGRTVALFERGRSAFVMLDESGHPEQLASGAQLLSEMN